MRGSWPDYGSHRGAKECKLKVMDNLLVSVIILLTTFWASVILFFVSLARVKRDPKLILGAAIYSMAAIVPTAGTCLAWSIWSIVGFAP